MYTSRVKYTSTNISLEYHYWLGLPLKPNASMPPLVGTKGLSMPMSRGGGGLIDNCTSDACGGGGWSVDEEAHDTCKGEGGGGRSMDGAAADTSGLGGGRIRRVGRSRNGASSDVCGYEWEDVDHTP